MKRIFYISIALMATLALVFCSATATFAADTQDSEYLRVGLTYGSGAPATATISAASELALCVASDGSLSEPYQSLGVTSVVLAISAGSVTISDATGTLLATISGGGTECIVTIDGAYISYGEKSYRGGIVPYINSSGTLNVINYVTYDDYVRGVLHAEIGQASALETIKAQAVAARSYAYANRNNHKSQGFDVCTTVHCQSYSGVAGEYASTNQAVDETAGQMMYYDGTVVAGYYHSNSGGHTENCEDVWTSPLGYLRGVEDIYSPEMKWTVTLTKAQLDTALASKNIGSVVSVSIDSVDDAGYVSAFTINGTAGSFTKKKDNIRSIFGSAASLKSRKFSIDTVGGTLVSASGAASQSAATYYMYDGSVRKTIGESLQAVSASGTELLSLDGLCIMNANGDIVKAEKKSESIATPAEATVYLYADTDQLVINGMGYGHGVGMSQQGAQQMGRLGFSYEDILHYYYTDIEIK